MIKKISSIVFILGIGLQLTAQKKSNTDQSVSFTVAFASSEFSTSLGYQYLWKLGKKQQWRIGAGARFTNYFGSDQYYTTAPAELTSGKTGPAVFFSEDIPQNIDTVIFNSAQVNAFNISLNFTYNIYKKFTLGFNIDAIGFSFGGTKDGFYLGNGGTGLATTARPTAFNLLLISDNDKGSLNSEFFVQYTFNKKWGAKLGYQYLFTEYTTATNVQTTPDGQQNDQFRNKSSGISMGVTRSF